jgi:hypothetical protein
MTARQLRGDGWITVDVSRADRVGSMHHGPAHRRSWGAPPGCEGARGYGH